jgi:hypothetical protein
MKNFQKKFGRRAFLKSASLAAISSPLILSPSKILAADETPVIPRPQKKVAELSADLIIIGGGFGGCACALAAARNGLNVILTEETNWIGGQLTQQAVPPDENKWIETFGASRSYQNLRTKIREFYFRDYPLTEKARADKYFNPGNSWVSRIGGEPRVGLAVIYEMLAPFLGNGQIQILLRYKAIDAQTDGDKVSAVRVLDLELQNEIILRGKFFADATERDWRGSKI